MEIIIGLVVVLVLAAILLARKPAQPLKAMSYAEQLAARREWES